MQKKISKLLCYQRASWEFSFNRVVADVPYLHRVCIGNILIYYRLKHFHRREGMEGKK